MRRFLGRFKTLVGVVLLLIFPFVFLHVKKKIPAASGVIAGGVLDVAAYFQTTVLGVFGGISDSLERYFIEQESKNELFELRRQKRELRSLQILLVESEKENQHLRELLNFSSYLEGPRLLGAAVIGEVGTPLMRTIQIDQGSKAGVRKGDAVISRVGAIGQVLLAGPHYSEVLLLADPSSAVDVLVQRSRVKGILRGLQVRDFDRLGDIQIGDVLVTSGLGAKFPEGTPVGKIRKIANHKQGLYLEAEVESFVNFGRLEQVLVLLDASKNKPWRRKELISNALQMSVKP